MAKLITPADAAVIQALVPKNRARFMGDFKGWWIEGRRLTDNFVQAATELGLTIDANDDTAIKGKLTAWFATQPDPADYV